MFDRVHAGAGPRGVRYRPEVGMPRRLTIMLLLQLASMVCLAPVSARQDLAEVERNGQEPVLEPSDRGFLPFAGKPIRRIRVRNFDVFGASIDDTTLAGSSRLARFANHLNFQTRQTTIRQNLFFREGDPVDPFRLAESERILRDLAYIGDARIVAAPAPGVGDSVDVLILVKETWTLRFSQSLKEGNRMKVTLAERNLLGLGHQVSAAGMLAPHATSRSGFDAHYAVSNLHGTFVSGMVEYVRLPDQEISSFAFSRELISPILRYAGGLNLMRTSITVPDSTPFSADNSSELIDLWAGRSVHHWYSRKDAGRAGILFLSGRVRHLKFTRRPPVTPSTFSQYHDLDHLLGSLSYIHSSYYRTNLLFNFGRTENVPYGFLARITYGLADQEFTRTNYGSATLAAGEKLARLGYGVGEFRVGGYPGSGTIAQGVIRARTLWFSNLLPVGGFRLRQFTRVEYATGIHRFTDDSINFTGDGGIRGVTYDNTVTGGKRLLLNLETVAFTPWRVRGVTIAVFTFADLDFIGVGGRSILGQKHYAGLGLGVRLHKDAFGIGPVQLRFAWYPVLPIHHRAYAYTAFAEERFQSIGLLGIEPEIVEY
jgi:hypothetical protein